jgi:hypothetical protein
MEAEFPTLTAERYAELLAEHAHRSPEPVTLTVLGDRGVEVQLPFIIGNPSGTCAMPADRISTPIWNNFVLANLTDATTSDNSADLGVLDCLLWPEPQVWIAWQDRWPALPQMVWGAVKAKAGASGDIIGTVPPGATPTPAMQTALMQHPKALIRRYTPTKAGERQRFIFLIDPPQSVAYRFFRDALKKRPLDAWAETLPFARKHAVFVYDERADQVISADQVFAAWPGIALLVTMAVHALGGATAKFELGEFTAGISAPATTF